MEQINFSNKRLVSDAGETKTYLINVNGTDVRVYESTKTNRFGFNMKDLAKAFNYETVEEFQASEQWKEFSSQISENLQKNTGDVKEAQIGKVSDVIGEVPAADTIPIKYQKIKTTNITVYQYITFSHLCQYNPYFPIYSQSLSLFCPPNKI